jgi:hypothetical protein
MAESEKRILNRLRVDAARAASLFSNAGQELQERTAVAGLLRTLRIDFKKSDIVKRGPEPIDIWFRDARFQVTELLDRDRRRNSEVKERSVRISKARRLSDLIEPGTVTSDPITPRELTKIVSERATEKQRKYGNNCLDIDLLVYVNLHRRHLFPTAPFPKTTDELFDGWRSVSVIMERFAMVLWASPTAPQFIQKRTGKPCTWTKLESVFPRLDRS